MVYKIWVQNFKDCIIFLIQNLFEKPEILLVSDLRPSLHKIKDVAKIPQFITPFHLMILNQCPPLILMPIQAISESIKFAKNNKSYNSLNENNGMKQNQCLWKLK